MKYTKTCPKCRNSNIVRFNGFSGAYGAGNHIETGVFSSVNVNRYVCCYCGYTEEWIDTEDLSTIVNSKKAIR